MRPLADVTNPATRLVLMGTAPLSRLTSAELAYVLTDPDLQVRDEHGEYEHGILGELRHRARRGDPIATRTVARYVEDGDQVVCACGVMHDASGCPNAIGHGELA